MSIDPCEDTQEIPPVQMAPPAPEPLSSLVRVDIAARTDIGKVRATNDDHVVVGRYGRYLDVFFSSLPEGELPVRSDDVAYGMIIADGMGGASGGEIAARIAVRTLVNLVLNTPDWIMRFDVVQSQRLMERLIERFRTINAEIMSQGELVPSLSGMGTTMTVAAILGEEMVIAHVGDSRAYLLRDDELRQLTRDQTMVALLVELGIISREEAATHHLRNVLMNVLGREFKGASVEVHRIGLKDGDQVLLCTDGLTNMVADEKIADILGNTPTADHACENLVQAALEAGGKDNVTVVAARYAFP